MCSGLWLASVFVNHSTMFGCFVFGFGGRNSCWIKSLLFWVNTSPLSFIPGIQLLLLLSSFNTQALNWTKWNYCLCFLLWHINSKNTCWMYLFPPKFSNSSFNFYLPAEGFPPHPPPCYSTAFCFYVLSANLWDHLKCRHFLKFQSLWLFLIFFIPYNVRLIYVLTMGITAEIHCITAK